MIGGETVWGSLLSETMARYGWSYEQTLWEVSYTNLRMMTLDSVYIHPKRLDKGKEINNDTANDGGGPATFTDFLAVMKGKQ